MREDCEGEKMLEQSHEQERESRETIMVKEYSSSLSLSCFYSLTLAVSPSLSLTLSTKVSLAKQQAEKYCSFARALISLTLFLSHCSLSIYTTLPFSRNHSLCHSVSGPDMGVKNCWGTCATETEIGNTV